MLLSIIIPAYNEQHLIGHAIEAVHERIPEGLSYEVIVVDNGSTDRTRDVARDAGAVVVPHVEGTIGAVRNEGARRAAGEVFVFLDADVVLQPGWSQHIMDVLTHLESNPYTVTGSVCDVPAHATWIERYWFAPRSHQRFSHVGTGHMIVTRELFEALGGFDPTLATGEDYDFSRRAVAQWNAEVVLDQRLRVEHWGNPTSLRTFIMREVWHGGSDFRSWRSFVGSKVAMGAAAIVVLHMVLVSSLFLGWVLTAMAALGGVLAICAASAHWKYKGAPIHVQCVNAILFYFYYLARAVASVYRPRASRTRRVAASNSIGSRRD